jgi:hypothetical protein
MPTKPASRRARANDDGTFGGHRLLSCLSGLPKAEVRQQAAVVIANRHRARGPRRPSPSSPTRTRARRARWTTLAGGGKLDAHPIPLPCSRGAFFCGCHGGVAERSKAARLGALCGKPYRRFESFPPPPFSNERGIPTASGGGEQQAAKVARCWGGWRVNPRDRSGA